MKIAIVTDSNSAITPATAKEKGITVIPMPFLIDDEEFFEDVTITREDFYKKLHDGARVVTSQPSPEVVTQLWDNLLKDYDQIVHIPMSSGLSGACQTAHMLSEDYDGKVQVVNNQRICPTLRDSVYDALTLASQGMSALEIKEKLEAVKFESTIYIMVGTLEYLKRGGRITPAVATIGSLLKLKPVLAIHGEKLDAHATVRTLQAGKKNLVDSAISDMKKLIGDEEPTHYHISVAYSEFDTEAQIFKKELEDVFPGCEIIVEPLSLSVACHIGPESLAIALSRKIEVS